MDLRYWVSAGGALLRHTRTPGFARDVATAGLRADTAPRAPTLGLLDAFPDLEGVLVDLGFVAYRRSNMDPLEQYVLGALAQVRQPRRIFEIGTYDGATTLLLARNAPDAEVFTLDLPPEGAGAATVTEEVKNAGQGVGRRFRGTDESERITQLLGDSRTFDFGPWYGTVDFVVVDGGHELDCVRADTATAFRLLKPGGVIVWDDYERGWPGVVQAVDECGRPTTHIAGTALAVYR